MDAVIIAVAAFFNLAIIKWKYEKDRTADAIFDLSALIALNYMFRGTIEGATIATIASAIMSIYLLFYPPKFLQEEELDETTTT